MTNLTRNALYLLAYAGVALWFSAAAHAQRVAIVTPDATGHSRAVAERFAAGLEEKFRVLDTAMAEAAFAAVRPETPFNMTTAQAKDVAVAIGCDFFVLLKSETLRRSSSARAEYYESYMVVYIIDGRTGELLSWDLASFEENSQPAADARLISVVPTFASTMARRLSKINRNSIPPAPQTATATNADEKEFRSPIPYKRIRPEYTRTAFMYGVSGTVDIEADIDETGKISRTSIVRWAGYGLDESVERAVRTMNWRPAMRSGKPLPMRVLLRYNFTKIEKD